MLDWLLLKSMEKILRKRRNTSDRSLGATLDVFLSQNIAPPRWLAVRCQGFLDVVLGIAEWSFCGRPGRSCLESSPLPRFHSNSWQPAHNASSRLDKGVYHFCKGKLGNCRPRVLCGTCRSWRFRTLHSARQIHRLDTVLCDTPRRSICSRRQQVSEESCLLDCTAAQLQI